MRCALQVNPFAYGTRHGVDSGFTEEGAYNDALIEALLEADVRLIAVTDHFRIADSESLLSAARAAGIVALPGFEASTVEGVHFLVVLDEQSRIGDIERLIGKCDVRDVDTPSPHSGISSVRLLRLCADEKAACIAAHVTHANGLLEHLQGQARKAAWKSEYLYAVAIPGSVNVVPERHKTILLNKDREYKRDIVPALLNAGDVSSPEMVTRPGASCLLRLSAVTQAGLRHALLDPASRVRLDTDEPRRPRPCLVALHWEGGLLDEQTIPLAGELNVLIGAPGAGKSTVIESIRAAFELSPSSARAREDHHGIVEKVLRNGTTVSVVIDHPSPAPVRYVIERRLPNPSVVRVAESWATSDRQVADLAPIPQIYGQHEIADLAADSARRTALLHRFVGRREDLQGEYDETAASLKRSRRRVHESASKVEELQAELSLLPGAREKLKLFGEANVADRVAEQVLLDREFRVIERARSLIDELGELLQTFGDERPDGLLDLSSVAESPFLPQLERAGSAVHKPFALATVQQQTLRTALDGATTDVGVIFDEWKTRRAEADQTVQAARAQLEGEGIDYEDFRAVQQQVDKLGELEPKLQAATSARDKTVTARRELLLTREKLEATILKGLRKAASRVSTMLAPSVRIEVNAVVDHDLIERILRKPGGRLNESLTLFRQDATFSARALVETARSGTDALGKKWGLPPQQAAKIASLPRLVLLELEEAPLGITTAIQLNTAPEDSTPIWTPIEELSKGQQAIAVLLLLLLDSEAPLIVDQPEDDLDNRFISTRVVPAVRDAKHHRQFVFSTHNANVPVLADAELVIGISAKDSDQRRGEVLPEHIGAVDAPSVRALIERRLEGGRDAFEARRRRYRLD